VTGSFNDPPTTNAYAPTKCSTTKGGGCIAKVIVDYDFKYLAGILGLPGERHISSTSQFMAQGPQVIGLRDVDRFNGRFLALSPIVRRN
jgi:hypothetical protein